MYNNKIILKLKIIKNNYDANTHTGKITILECNFIHCEKISN